MEYAWAAVWVAVFICAIIIEAQTAELVSIWFVPGAIIALVLSLFKVEWWIQLIVFVGVSALLLLLSRTVFKKWIMKGDSNSKTDLDLLVGETAVVCDRINNIEETGSVKLKGQIWSARMIDSDTEAQAGELVVVVEIVGVKLICRKK